jgi:hypothetical protein
VITSSQPLVDTGNPTITTLSQEKSDVIKKTSVAKVNQRTGNDNGTTSRSGSVNGSVDKKKDQHIVAASESDDRSKNTTKKVRPKLPTKGSIFDIISLRYTNSFYPYIEKTITTDSTN